MKKIISFCFCIGFAFSGLFADHDIILTPTIGYTNTTPLKYNTLLPSQGYFYSHNADLEFTVGLILDNGFTYFEDVGFAIGTAYLTGLSPKKNGGGLVIPSFFFESRSLIGYTFKTNGKLYINLLGGLGLTVGFPQLLQIGIPINIGIQYFFGKKAGLNITAVDMIGIGAPFFFTNSFSIKIGPIFRL